MTYMATPKRTRTPAPGGHEIYNFGGLFLDYYILRLSYLCSEEERKNFKGIIHL